MWQDFIRTNFVSVSPDYTISKALHSLAKEKVLLVFKDKNFQGAISRKNLLRIGVSLPEEKVSTVMIKPPHLTRSDNDLDVAKYFIQYDLHKLVVFDKNKVIGVLDRIDFLENVVKSAIGSEEVNSVTTTNVVIIAPNATLAQALGLFKEHNISKLVVISEGSVKGVITLTNILNYFMNSSKLTIANLKSTLVKDVMKDDIYSINIGERISKAIDVFRNKHMSSLVVLNKGLLFAKGNLYGIVTKTDLLSRFISQSKQSKIMIHITSKMKNVDSAIIEKKLESLDKVLDKGTQIFVHLKQGKEKFRGLPLINCRLRIVKTGRSENISVEGWGLEHSIELAVHKIKRRLTEHDFS